MRTDRSKIVTVHPEVAEALMRGRPVVALESAVISHGLPHPTGAEVAEALENEIRSSGAVPATIAVIAGRITVGLTRDEVEQLVRPDVMKVASRDLPVAVALHATGGTTVSATLAVAESVRVPVLSTGGIGGVHLGAQETWDVSADLLALARYPVAVVCAGAKTVCDVARTLEYLDTTGVTVVAYRTDRFPNFFTRDSGSIAPRRIESADDAARILMAKRLLGQRSGLLIANPIPAADALSNDEVDGAVRRAIDRARGVGVRGGDLTPYLLAALGEITAGGSLRANVALLKANAALAAAVAVAVAGAGEESILR